MSTHDYLEPDFDPGKARVADLRRILFENDVNPPATAKKPDLVNMFNHAVKPKIPLLLKVKKSVKASSVGVMDMSGDAEPKVTSKKASSRRTTVGGSTFTAGLLSEPEQPTESVVKAKTPKGRRKTESVEVKTDVEYVPEESAQKKSVSTRKKKQVDKSYRLKKEEQDSDSDHVITLNRTPAKPHKSPKVTDAAPGEITVAPVTLSELLSDVDDPKEVERRRRRMRLSGTFSDANPFQSGGESPRSDISSKKVKVKKEKVDEFASPIVQPKSGVLTRVVNKIQPSPPTVVARAVVHSPPRESPLKRAKDRVVRGARHAAQVASAEGNAWISIVLIVVVLLSAIGVGYVRQIKLEKGYCDTGVVPEPSQGSFAFLNPTCMPCPFRGECYAGTLERCETGFLIRPAWFSFVWPRPAMCTPDTVRQRSIEELVQMAQIILDVRAGEVICGDIAGTDGGLTLNELRERIFTQRRSSVTMEQFDDIWDAAAKDLQRHTDDVVISGSPFSTTLTSKHPSISFMCHIRISIVQALVHYLYHIMAMLVILGGTLAVRYQYQASQKEKDVVQDIVEQVLQQLMDQYALYRQEPSLYVDAAVSVTHLRDLLLRFEHDHRRRYRLWTRVQAIVEANSNVRTRVMDIRGEANRVWEWVGPLQTPQKMIKVKQEMVQTKTPRHVHA